MKRPGALPGRPLRVLLVEDSENDAMLLLRELRRGGYEPVFRRVFTPEEMEQALEEASGRDEAFEMVISDYYMPRFRAPDALTLLRGLGYDTPFIVVSGKIGEDAAVGIMKAGADDYLTKENMSRLCPAIERELGEAEVRRERERAEEALSRSEDRFRRLVEQIPAVTYVQEPIASENPKAITYMSPQYQAMLGYPPGEGILDEQHWLGALHPEDRERVLAEELRTDETGEPFRIEYRQIARDGRVVWVRDQATLIRDEAGQPLYWLGVQYDITDQKEAEAALRESEDRFRLLADEAVAGIVLIENGAILDANKGFTQMFGYGLGELVGVPVTEFVVPEDREAVARRVSSGDTEAYEIRGLRKDGTAFPLELRPRQLPYKGRRVRLTSVVDLTERRRAEEALKQSEELYRTVVEQAAESIFLVDTQTLRILQSNAALQTSLGYTAEDLKQMKLYDIVANDQESVDRNIERIMEEGRSFLGERQYTRRDGTIADVEVSVSAVPYDGREVMCVVAHDVAERKRTERALEEIREAERNRIARELHDSTMQDIVHALQEIQVVQAVSEGGGEPGLEDAAEALRRSVEGLRGAIFELRLEDTLGRSFAASLENLIDLNRRMARGRYELELIVQDGFPSRLTAKAGRELARIVQEALTNVRRHADARHVWVRLGLEGEVARVEVSDDGRGFVAENQKVGIGRHSMQGRALELGGELRIESEPGRGTRVSCLVPVSRLTQVSEEATSPGSGVSPSPFELD